MKPLNVIYMHSHDTGRHISPFGFAVNTPHMQQFAEQGVLFRQAFCAAPTCSPSRAALITGQPSHTSGMLGLTHRGFKLHDYKQTWVNAFRQAGYETAVSGTDHIGIREHAGDELGYEHNLASGSSGGEKVATAAAAFISQSHDRPFFLDIGFGLTHRTGQWHNGKESPIGDPRYVQVPATLPDTPTTRQDFADFRECVHRLDSYYGRVLATLAKTGLADHTVVLITTDHGIAFPGMKCHLTDHGIGVLLMLRGPKSLGLAGGKVVDAMVSHTDVFPTLCDLLNLPAPGHLTGRSLRPLLDGSVDASKPDALNDAIFSEVTYHAAYEPKRCVRTKRYKYIRHFAGATATGANIDDSVSKSLWMNAGAYEQPRPQERLYDLLLDPNEMTNLAYEPSHREMAATLRDRLEQWMKETRDPLLAGSVPAPPGSKVTRYSGNSPRGPLVPGEEFDPAQP